MYHLETAALRPLVEKQEQFLQPYFATLDWEKGEEIIDRCFHCKGHIILTGVGKSGLIAEKIAMTLISTGTRALYLPTLNFLHGDIGAVGEEDLVLMLSKSGESQELLTLLPPLKQKGSTIIALTSDEKSRLAKKADLSLYLPLEKELCPFDLAPTISTTVQLLFGDALAVALMEKKGFTLEGYAQNHPSGSIGKKITCRVADLMLKGDQLPLCEKDEKLVNLIVLLSDKKCGCLLVVDGEKHLLGVFTDGDLRRALQQEGSAALEKPIGDWMNRDPIILHPQDLAYTAMKKMQNTRYVMVAPVLENKKVVGLIRMHDIIHEGI